MHGVASKVAKVGVVGAGTIGRGVALALANGGHDVTLVDVSVTQLREAEVSIARDARLFALVGPSRTAGDATKRVRGTSDLAALKDVDFVIENVTERWEVKRSLYPELDSVCAPHVPIGVNTSAIPITRLAGLTRRAERVIGMHCMNPVPLMPVVELIRGLHTSDETVETARHLVESMGKSAIVVRDSPGFVTNRVMMLMINEAIFLLDEQVASIEDIDRLFKTCFGHKMGPLETADLIGLDTVLYSIEVLFENFRDGKYRPSPLLARMVDGGWCGRKTGRGFYRYDGSLMSRKEGARL